KHIDTALHLPGQTECRPAGTIIFERSQRAACPQTVTLFDEHRSCAGGQSFNCPECCRPGRTAANHKHISSPGDGIRSGVGDKFLRGHVLPAGWCQLPLIVMPPSTRTTSPVMNDASSDARKTISWATSSGWPKRPRACILFQVAINVSASSVSSKIRSFIGVMMVPGATALMRILRGE